MDELLVRAAVDLFTEIAHVYFDGVRKRVYIALPDVFHKHASRYDRTVASHKAFCEREFFAGEIYVRRSAFGFLVYGIEHQITGL